MKCPRCGKDVEDFVSSCPNCGADLHPSSGSSSVPTGSSSGDEYSVLTPENFRNAPHYKRNLLIMILYGSIGLVFSALAVVGSALFRFVPLMEMPGLIMFIFSLLVGLTFFIVAMTYNKKVFPTTQMIKMKGLEILVPLIVAFTLVFIIGSLAIQGIFLIIY